MNIEIGHTDLKPVVKWGSGLKRISPGTPGCTAPWSRLQAIGLSAVRDLKEETSQHTAKIDLFVSEGAIRNRNISRYYKEVFKKEVFPAIKNFKPDGEGTFHLILHYRRSLLFQAELVYTS